MELVVNHRVTGRGKSVYTLGMIELRTFGERVEWLLKRPEHGNGMSQKELAAAMGLSAQFLGALLNGKRRPNVRHVTQIAKILHTSVSFLMLENDIPAPVEDADAARVNYFLPQADEAAQLIDDMRDDELRSIALDIVRVLAMYATEGEDSPAHAPGGASGRLILSKLLGNLKKAGDTSRASSRASSE